jgi:hypothetical protein
MGSKNIDQSLYLDSATKKAQMPELDEQHITPSVVFCAGVSVAPLVVIDVKMYTLIDDMEV